MDLSTNYLGLKLKNPIVASSSPLTWDLNSALSLQEAGASAIIMPSLFEEQIEIEQNQLTRFVRQPSIGYAEVTHFHPPLAEHQDCQTRYINQLKMLKNELEIPVIASLNGVSSGGWVQYAAELQQAGADALELNVYYIAGDPEETSAQVEKRYIDILESVRKQIKIPVSIKLSHQFSAIITLVKRLELAGANGVSVFNRFYQPDIDLETLNVVPSLELSTSNESMLRIRWVAMLFNHVSLALSITGGMHNTEDILKGLLAGADITCMCSALLLNGPEQINRVLDGMTAWMEEKEYESVEQLKGSLSYQHAINPAAYERANYLEVLDNCSYPTGVMV